MEQPEHLHGVKLGIDVGMVRVGLASCDPDGILATPVKTLSRDVKKNSDVRVVVKEAAARHAVEVFVGLPRTLKGTETASARMARDYAGLLAAALAGAGLDVPVRLIDERLTTVTAHQALHAAGIGSRDHRKLVDQAAAVGILQQALDMQKARNQSVGELVHAPQPGTLGNANPSEEKEGSAISDSMSVPPVGTTRPQGNTNGGSAQ
ncbi:MULTISPECIES: Holliday junction resolvase RuvX [unclassified Arthrobacter]|uniref:Holliday junction resolvase RuvX n=1 Tax=unclassified Arthrobacter TaxID=235627 RepID=UPI00159E63D5|nr:MULTISPECIES: Holliday junction resolvase RuvX [unclassified Arthrobacter]MCQ9164370.1 Holliday junction resolvase RuvX [Arthrobacter sp. STN4]NVM97914.1 Holliday junction resolvase RuvX [Arthrobacter sp. SDTb3-6]